MYISLVDEAHLRTFLCDPCKHPNFWGESGEWYPIKNETGILKICPPAYKSRVWGCLHTLAKRKELFYASYNIEMTRGYGVKNLHRFLSLEVSNFYLAITKKILICDNNLKIENMIFHDL